MSLITHQKIDLLIIYKRSVPHPSAIRARIYQTDFDWSVISIYKEKEIVSVLLFSVTWQIIDQVESKDRQCCDGYVNCTRKYTTSLFDARVAV